MTKKNISAKIVTRFAPSPTGFLHIGGARTALFNWLFARHHGGQFLLRIEDTDRARSTDAATAAIFDGLRWLGLDWDGDAISQSQRSQRHREAAASMLEAETAYRCYATQEEISAFREQARSQGKPLFVSPWRERTDHPDAPFTVRLKTPLEGQVVIDDAVQGQVRWDADKLDDLILLRSDGTPTYMLAVVVDDHDMGITHVIRGDDHLTNTARQSLIYRGLGWETPVFAHIPLIHGPDGAKLSKRHGALGIDAYRDMGYLPEAVLNYLARLGWSHGDDEFFTIDQAISWFGLDAIGRSAARFDFSKLESLNAQHMREMPAQRLLEAFETFVASQQNPPLGPDQRKMMEHALPELRPRTKTLHELYEISYYILAQRPLIPDEKAQKLLTNDTLDILARLTVRLQNVSEWGKIQTEEAVRAFAEEETLKLGKIAQPMRAALTGRSVSPGVFDVLETLGRDESIARLRDAVATKT